MSRLKEPKIKQIEKIIFNPVIKKQINESPEVLRIETNSELTKIDFIYYAKPYYINGGWVQISRDTFIRPKGSNLKLKLVSATNITITPKKTYLKSNKAILCYTLYFPALPESTKSIDIIECEATGENWFNFYDVSLERIKSQKIVVGN